MIGLLFGQMAAGLFHGWEDRSSHDCGIVSTRQAALDVPALHAPECAHQQAGDHHDTGACLVCRTLQQAFSLPLAEITASRSGTTQRCSLSDSQLPPTAGLRFAAGPRAPPLPA